MNAQASPLLGSYTRRHMLRHGLHGSMGLGILSMLGSQEAWGSSSLPLHGAYLTHAPKAKRVIMIFLDGGLSHVDSFDYKPMLFKDDLKSVPNTTFKRIANTTKSVFVKRPEFEFKACGQSGMMLSDMFPQIRELADELCMVKSLTTDHANHFEAVVGMHSGSFNVLRPSIGSWVNYALGSENQNLPGFVALASELPYGGSAAFSCDFLPSSNQGVRIRPGAEPVRYLKPSRDAKRQDLQLNLLRDLNLEHQTEHAMYDALDARIKSWQVAAGMQLQAPEALDVSKEPEHIREAYGINRKGKDGEMAWKCLAARRLVERGVRFVEVIQRGWDAHGDVKGNHTRTARAIDQPVAALLKDLKSRGMLDDTLVIFTTEFGRTPTTLSAGHNGREHHPYAFSSWMAGAGVKPGISYGESDEHGVDVVKDRVHVHDFHATILHLLGIDHEKLTFRHAGRDFRLTDVAGHVVHPLLS